MKINNTSGDHLVDQKEKEMSTRQQLVEEEGTFRVCFYWRGRRRVERKSNRNNNKKKVKFFSFFLN